ncbi:MAG: ACT domain-containing protein [Selenomonadales bacterium]|nr:ACT domain-containing protein [Selenomonadales bacterium]MDD6218656.1 ACT domain-containing protein [Selenomonadaceae bacterium]
MKLVVTIVGKDQVGIIAMISNILAKNNVNILSVNQNIMDGYFNMVMMAQVVDGSKIKLGELQQMLKDKGAEMNLDIKIQNQEIFNVMHNI